MYISADSEFHATTLLRDKNQEIGYLSLFTNPGCVKHLISRETKKIRKNVRLQRQRQLAAGTTMIF